MRVFFFNLHNIYILITGSKHMPRLYLLSYLFLYSSFAVLFLCISFFFFPFTLYTYYILNILVSFVRIPLYYCSHRSTLPNGNILLYVYICIVEGIKFRYKTSIGLYIVSERVSE